MSYELVQSSKFKVQVIRSEITIFLLSNFELIHNSHLLQDFL